MNELARDRARAGDGGQRHSSARKKEHSTVSSLRMTVLEIPAGSLLAGPQDPGRYPSFLLRQQEAFCPRVQIG